MDYIQSFLNCKGGFRYYEKLDNSEKLIYDALLNSFLSFNLKVNFKNTSDEKVQKIIHYVLYDHPYIFYISNEFLITCYKDSVTFEFELVYSIGKIKVLNKKLDKEIKKIVKQIKSNSKSQYEEFLLLNSIICRNIEIYNPAMFDFEDGQIVGALLNKKARCEGVAKLSAVLLRNLGYCSSMIHGYSWYEGSTTQKHGWNLLYYNNNYYHMDFSYNLSYSSQSFICKSFLFLTDKEIFMSHKYERNIGYPICNDESLNYFRKANLVVKNNDYSNIKFQSHGKQVVIEYKLSSSLSSRQIEDSLASIIINELKINFWKDVIYKHVEYINDLYLLIKIK